MQGLRDNLHARVEALAREVDRLRARAEHLERGIPAEDADRGAEEWPESERIPARAGRGCLLRYRKRAWCRADPPILPTKGTPQQPSRRWLLPPPTSTTATPNSAPSAATRDSHDASFPRKTGSGIAEMHGTAEERRRARLAAVAASCGTHRLSAISSPATTQTEYMYPPHPINSPGAPTYPWTAQFPRSPDAPDRAAQADFSDRERMTSRGRVVVDRERAAAVAEAQATTTEDPANGARSGSRTPTQTIPMTMRSFMRAAVTERTATAIARPWLQGSFIPSPAGGTAPPLTAATRRTNSPLAEIPTTNERTPGTLPFRRRRRFVVSVDGDVIDLDRNEFPTPAEAAQYRLQQMSDEASIFTTTAAAAVPSATSTAERLRPDRLPSPPWNLAPRSQNSTSDSLRLPPPTTPTTTDTSFTPRAIAELRALQNTVTRLNDRLEIARGNMAMLALARSSLRSHERGEELMGGRSGGADAGEAPGRVPVQGREGSLSISTEPPFIATSNPVSAVAPPEPSPSTSAMAGRSAASPSSSSTATQHLARRPSFPYPRNPAHPHHRPRLGPQPIALVLNIDNMNSFDINFDGTVVYRPISAREPDRELVARCLSMLPGGRDGTPSRWMRLTGNGTSRPRRAGTSAGYWVRWVCEQDPAAPAQASGLRLRSLDMTRLPRIVAFDFSISPPDDDAFIRADEIEFITPRTRLRPTVGPWMHSRVRIEPFESDPEGATWGTSAHVRQAVAALGGLPAGHYIRYHLRERQVEAYPRDPAGTAAAAAAAGTAMARQGGAGASASPSRTVLARVLGSYESLGMDVTTDSVPATGFPPQLPPTTTTTTPPPLPPTTDTSHIGETSDVESAWLMAYEPAIGQIRASWRAHFRRTRDEAPLVGAAVFAHTRTSESGQSSRREAREGSTSITATGLLADSHNLRPASNELWSREYLDENGVPHPALPINELVQSIREEEWQSAGSSRADEQTRSRDSPRTSSGGTPGHINYV